MPTYTQDNRIIQIFTPLGKDVLLMQGFDGQESVSNLFHFNLRLASENRNIEFKDIVGKKATIKVLLPDEKARYINGIVNTFSQGGSSMLENAETPTSFSYYHATLVPWFWFLTRTSDCRIFQDKSVPDIIEEIFKERGFTDFQNRLTRSYDKREYCVQYRETAFNFVSRLMEEEGIFYFFEHSEEKHSLILSDGVPAFKPCPLQDKVSYKTLIGQDRDDDVVSEFVVTNELRSGKYTVNDFNFEFPVLDLTANVTGSGDSHYEFYDYPGEYKTKGEGERLVGVRVEEESTAIVVIKGESTCRGFIPGYRFELRDHYRRDLNKDYVLTSVFHSADLGTNWHSNEGDDGQESYRNSFQCIPYPTPYRPVRRTPVPMVYGTQTAIVVGPAGEEIYTDKYGRVKVQFHWDRIGQYNENSSCWIRVSHLWAGKGWGAINLPRIGQEVIVDFLEGDPDRPIITGRVYNADCMPPYALPDEQTKSTLKSYSSKGGGGFNEIRLEDKKGSEQLFIHAEKNQDNRVKNESLEWVGKDRHLIVKGMQAENVGGDKHLTIKGNQNEKVDGSVSLKAGMDLQQKVGKNFALDAAMEVHIKAGVSLVIEAGTTLTLKVGGNYVNINPAGVFITGTMVMINSGGAAGSGSGASPEAPKDAKEADKAEPGTKPTLPPPKHWKKPEAYSPAALVLQQAAQSGVPFCDI